MGDYDDERNRLHELPITSALTISKSTPGQGIMRKGTRRGISKIILTVDVGGSQVKIMTNRLRKTHAGDRAACSAASA